MTRITFVQELVPSKTKWEPPPRLPGGVDDTGKSLPMCEPKYHKDGKHDAIMCIAGILGYTQAADGWWDRIPPHPLSLPGAKWSYRGHAYVRPVERGVALDDGAEFDYLDHLPTGDYTIRVEFIRDEPDE